MMAPTLARVPTSHRVLFLCLLTTTCQIIISTEPVPLSRLNQSQSTQPDGTIGATEASATTSTTTVVNDIRKLLEDYVSYLASLPDLQKGISHLSEPHMSSHQGEEVIAAEESEQRSPSTLVLEPPLAYHPYHPQAAILITDPTAASASLHSPPPRYLLEIPSDSAVSLSLSDEELSSFIDTVLGSIPSHPDKSTVDNSTNSNSTQKTRDALVKLVSDKLETIIPHNAHQTNFTSVDQALFELRKDIEVLQNHTRSDLFSANTEEPPTSDSDQTTTINPFKSRAEIYEESDEGDDKQNDKLPPTDEAERRLLTTEPETSTEPVETNHANNSTEDEIANMRNMDDVQLLHELKRTKDLLQVHIDKLKTLEKSSSLQLAPEVTELTTTSVELSNFTTTEVPINLAIDGNSKASESLLNPVTETPEMPTTTVNVIAVDERSTTSATEVTTTEPVTTTTTTTTVPVVIIKKRLRAKLKHKRKKKLNVEAVGSGPSVVLSSLDVPRSNVTKQASGDTNDDALPGNATRRHHLPSNRTNFGARLHGLPANEAENLVKTNLTQTNATNSLSTTNITLDNEMTSSGTINETDSETMILTHVPKITIIHKIQKTTGRNSSDEESYKEALRRHKELIKSTVQSISLYPAAFKRYKINQNNRVNSVGEIYLLPNLAGLDSSPSQRSPQVIRVDKQLVLLGKPKSSDDDDPNGLDLSSNDATNRPTITKQRQPRLDNDARGGEIMKFAYHKAQNKFNKETKAVVSVEEDADELTADRAWAVRPSSRVYFNYFNSLPIHHTNDGNGSPENLLKFYRPPRFMHHRKRYKKVRIPVGHRFKKSNSATYKQESPVAAASNASLARQVVSYLNEAPVLITFGGIRPARHRHQSPGNRTKPDSRPLNQTSSHQSATSGTGSKLQTSSKTSSFKVFCTYDAHRSLSLSSNDSSGRYFDINQLEHNSVILQQCTHLVYAFAGVNMNGEIMASAGNGARDDILRAKQNQDPEEENLNRLQRLRVTLPHLKILVAIGGWNTPPQLFSLLVATSRLRDRLAQSIHKFVLEHDLDGALLSWFYPVYGSKSTMDNSRTTRSTGQTLFQLDDKQNLVKLMRSLRLRFDSIPHKKLELGIMAPPFEELIDRGYDVPRLAELADHLILMTYDYYGSWEDKVHHFAPLYPVTANLTDERDHKFNINYTLNYWLKEKGAPREKTTIGIAFYGRSFTLANPNHAEPGSLATGPGIAGPMTNKPGLLAFNELCELYLGNSGVRLREDQHRITANLQLFDQWVGFDDELSLYMKTQYAIGQHLEGVFIWSINFDDYRNRCGWGRFPLLKAVNKAVEHCSSSRDHCRGPEALVKLTGNN